jgi:predicted deacylase
MSASGCWPSIEPYRAGNTGIDYVWSFAAAAPGPHAMVNALTHGNEPCGAVAVLRLLAKGIRPARGRLSLAFANPEAYAAFRAGQHAPARFLDRDLNRLWRDDWIDADPVSREAGRARELRPWLGTVDALLDLHSTASVSQPFFVLADLPKARTLADAMAPPAMQQIMPGGCIDGRHMIDYGRFADPEDAAVAITVECGRHDDAVAAGVAYDAVIRFLEVMDLVAAPFQSQGSEERAIRRYRTVEPYVVQSDRFELLVPRDGFVSVRSGQTVAVDGDDAVVAPYDAVIIAPRPDPLRGATGFLWAVEVSSW